MKWESVKRRKKCLAVTAGVVVAIVVIIVILAFTVFKAKRPITSMDSVKLDNLHVALDAARMSVDLNVTLKVDVTVENPNKVGFKYSETKAQLNYRGEMVGEVPVPAGDISSGERTGMNLTVTIMADRLISSPQLYSDVTSGTLPLNTFLRMSGKVTILGFVKVHVATSVSCDVNVNLSNRTVEDNVCQYKTKL
ncbi:hypothetical protein L6164_002538 [Bauhinia variegata]|uniref:Uncharacterized protein n=1 Tax=Bauhinia variegata TaxID=167791 RepID=A0ACB9PYI5_BAUVA|nr:hypothetical protein L6164_002538 [Bauhinia variegata]